MAPAKVLWLAPNLNHYKARLLERLNASGQIDLVVACGARDAALGHRYDDNVGFRLVPIGVRKRWWGCDPRVWKGVVQSIRRERPSAVLMPAEAKHLPLVGALSLLRRSYRFRLVSYNHADVGRSHRDRGWRQGLFKRILGLYDQIVFYSEPARARAVSTGLVPLSKSSYAPNTLDIESIREHVVFSPTPPTPPTILFLGRLLPKKGVKTLFDYYDRLRTTVPGLRVEVIGDGPMREVVADRSAADPNVVWHNAISDESRIALVMSRASVVLIPGETGLGIVHAFAYGKPFLTVGDAAIAHGPEVDYLVDQRNGLSLTGRTDDDVQKISALLNDAAALESLSVGAFETGTALYPDVWVERMCAAVLGSPTSDEGGDNGSC